MLKAIVEYAGSGVFPGRFFIKHSLEANDLLA